MRRYAFLKLFLEGLQKLVATLEILPRFQKETVSGYYFCSLINLPVLETLLFFPDNKFLLFCSWLVKISLPIFEVLGLDLPPKFFALSTSKWLRNFSTPVKPTQIKTRRQKHNLQFVSIKSQGIKLGNLSRSHLLVFGFGASRSCFKWMRRLLPLANFWCHLLR